MNDITKNTLKSLNTYSNNDNIKCTVEKSKDYKYVVKVEKDNKKMYIGSRYSVFRDVDSFIKELGKINPEATIIIFGIGAAEHLIGLKEKLEEKNRVLVIEPYINIIHELRNLSNFNIFEDERFTLCLLNDVYLNEILSTFVNVISLKNIKIALFSNYTKIFPEESKEFFHKLNIIFTKVSIDRNTSRYFSVQFTKCYLKNICQIIKSSSINEFKNVFTDKPAVVVSAGPSLSQNIHELKEVQDKLIIITGARSLEALLDNGINPNFICLVDPGDINCNFIKDKLDLKVPMVFHEYSNYKAVGIYGGGKIFFSSHYITQNMINRKIDSLTAGGSVAHTCTSMALYMGCNPVIFIGQDFAYTGEKLHADISAHGERNKVDDSKEYIEVEDIYGNNVKTDKLLNNYRLNMENIIEFNKSTIFINSTEGGANMKNTLVMSLQETIDKYTLEIIDKSTIKNILNNTENYNEDRSNAVNYLNDTVETLKEVNEKCVKALDYNNDLYMYYKDIKKINVKNITGKLDDIDSFIKEKRNNIGMINFLLFDVVEKVLTKPEYMISDKDKKDKKAGKVYKKSRELYEGIKDKIDFFMPMLESTIEELQKEKVDN
ncbi:motility associated factor glycosyltransferase family protein [Clostridium sp. LBM24168]